MKNNHEFGIPMGSLRYRYPLTRLYSDEFIEEEKYCCHY